MTVSIPVHQMIAALPLPALVIGPDEQIIASNTLADTLLGMSSQGRHFVTVLRQPSIVDSVEACQRNGQAVQAQYLTRQNGNDATYTVSVGVIGDGGAVLLTFQDITMLTAAGQMRRDFVANVSHELRTPLTALKGFIETLRGPAKDDAAARNRFLGIMQDETERMNRLVGDLLSLSRVEADERVRPTEQVDIVGIIDVTIRNLNALAKEADVILVPNIDAASAEMLGDRDQLIQVFTNLIENAIKYGGSGKRVHISVVEQPYARSLRTRGVEITVRDEGPGIEGRHLPRLTERFYRADDHRNRAVGGTGLGLAIVKHILNRHRGRLKIRSDVGQGAEFTVLLPLE